MRRQSVSVVQLDERKKSVSPRKRANPIVDDQDIVAVAGADESTLAEVERTWLKGRLVVGLEKTRAVLDVINNDVLADNAEFNAISNVQSPSEVLAALNDKGVEEEDNNSKRRKKDSVEEEESVAVRIFRSVFNDEEWAELEASDQALISADEGRLRMLRFERQRKLFWETRNMAIELTVRDEAMVVEQTAVVNESMQVMNMILDRVGMNARGTMRRVLPPAPAPPVRQRQQQQQKKKAAVAVKVKPKAKAKVVVKKKKRDQDEQDEEQEQEPGDLEDELEEEEENASGSGSAEKRPKVTSDAEVEGGEVDQQDDVEEDGAEEIEGKEKQPAVEGEQQPQQEQQEVEEEEEDVEMEVEKFDLGLLLANAKLDVTAVTNLLKERDQHSGGLVLKVANIKLPDPNFASAKSGDVLLSDAEQLSQCLIDDGGADKDCLAVEQWGTLLKWWRVVNRAFSVAGIFASLRARKKVAGVKLKDRYLELVKRVKQQENVFSFTQATIYDRLGQFLLKFPRFVYQMQLVSLKDWFQKIDAGDDSEHDEKLIKCLEVHLNANDVESTAFWKQSLQIDKIGRPEEEEEEEEGKVVASLASASGVAGFSDAVNPAPPNGNDLCMVCKMVRPGFEVLWQCSGCDVAFFHEMCVGYDDGTICADIILPNGIELETLVYCKDCLIGRDLTVDDVAKAIGEVKSIGEFLKAPGCAFNLEKIKEDGYCCFRILENVARKSLGWRKNANDFCREVAKFAVKSAEAAAKEIGGDALESDTLRELKGLARQANPVDSLHNGLWKRLEVQHILNGFVELFKEKKVVVHVYQAGGSDGEVRNSETYGKDAGVESVEVNVLLWGMTEHFDCLVKKK